MEGFDIEAVLNFAEHLILNAPRLWKEAVLNQEQKLQKAFFSEGLSFANGEFEPAVTCLVFSELQTAISEESRLG